MNNGLVAAIVSEEDIEKLLSAVEQTGRAEVDLEAQTIKSGNYVVPFTIDPARRMRLLNGWDDLDLTATVQGPDRRIRREGSRRAAVGGAARLGLHFLPLAPRSGERCARVYALGERGRGGPHPAHRLPTVQPPSPRNRGTRGKQAHFEIRRFARFCAIDVNTLLSWLAWVTL